MADPMPITPHARAILLLVICRRILRRSRGAILAALMALMGVLPVQAHPDASDRFALCAGYCGLINGLGQRVTDRLFEHLDDFHGLVATYTRNGKFGAINRSGQRIIKPVHDAIWSPADDFLVAKDQDPKVPADQDFAIYTLFDAKGTELVQVAGAYDFRSWQGHVYYRAHCAEKQVCPTTVLNPAGKPPATFKYFDGGDDKFAIASLDNVHFGFVDDSLAFVVPPRYKWLEGFQQDVAIAYTEKGPVLINRQGKELLKPGYYSNLFVWSDKPMIEGFRANDPNCADYLDHNGNVMVLPNGLCAHGDYLARFGYALIIDKSGLLGLVDAAGKMLLPPSYPFLKPLNDSYLVFSDEATKPKSFGLIDRHGKVILPLGPINLLHDGQYCCHVLRDAVLGLTPEHKLGLLNLDGQWRIPPQYRYAVAVSGDLVAMQSSDGRYQFFTDKGQTIPLFSDTEPNPIGSGVVGKSGPFFFTQESQNDKIGLRKGMADANGTIAIPAEYSNIEDAGDNLLLLKLYGTQDKIGFADRNGRILAQPQFSELRVPFHNGASVVRTAKGDALLFGEDGKTIASFNALYPEVVNNVDSAVEMQLDLCDDPDVTAEPEEKRPTSAAKQLLCSNPALRREAKEAERAWRSAQTGGCLPDPFLALRPAYDHALDQCKDSACASHEISRFLEQVKTTQETCGTSSPPLDAKWTIPASLQSRLIKRLGREAAEADEDIGDESREPDVSLQPIVLGTRKTILATSNTSANNSPLWIFMRNKSGGWDEVFKGVAGYLRPLELLSPPRGGLPLLRTQQHDSCCEHSVDFFAFDGKSYKELRSCKQLYGDDETALGFCEGKDDFEGNAKP